MIEDKDRNALIDYRLQQALDTFELAQFLMANQKLVVAVNRVYYGFVFTILPVATSAIINVVGFQ